MKLVNEKSIEIWNSVKKDYNLSDKIDCLRCIKDLVGLIDTQETCMQIMEKQIESASIKTKELEAKNQKLYDELIDCSTANIDFQSENEELKEENKKLKELIKEIWNITHGFGDNLNNERVEKIYDLIDEKFNQH